jgi:hypothetical protein
MLPLVELTEAENEQIVNAVPGGGSNIQDIYPWLLCRKASSSTIFMETVGCPYLPTGQFRWRARFRCLIKQWGFSKTKS